MGVFMTGKNKKRKFLSKEEMLAMVLVSAVYLFSSFTINKNGAGEEKADVDWVFFFSFAGLAVVLVVVINVVIVYILPKMRKSSEERNPVEENK